MERKTTSKSDIEMALILTSTTMCSHRNLYCNGRFAVEFQHRVLPRFFFCYDE